MLSLEIFKIERLVKIIHVLAIFEFINNRLKVLKILDYFPLNSCFGDSNRSTFLVYNRSEPWAFLADQAMNELMEVSVVDYSHNFFGYCLHVA